MYFLLLLTSFPSCYYNQKKRTRRLILWHSIWFQTISTSLNAKILETFCIEKKSHNSSRQIDNRCFSYNTRGAFINGLSSLLFLSFKENQLTKTGHYGWYLVAWYFVHMLTIYLGKNCENNRLQTCHLQDANLGYIPQWLGQIYHFYEI